MNDRSEDPEDQWGSLGLVRFLKQAALQKMGPIRDEITPWSSKTDSSAKSQAINGFGYCVSQGGRLIQCPS